MQVNRCHKQDKQNSSKNKPNKVTVPATYPDTRYPKTNIANPSDENVIRAKEWVEFDQL